MACTQSDETMGLSVGCSRLAEYRLVIGPEQSDGEDRTVGRSNSERSSPGRNNLDRPDSLSNVDDDANGSVCALLSLHRAIAQMVYTPPPGKRSNRSNFRRPAGHQATPSARHSPGRVPDADRPVRSY